MEKNSDNFSMAQAAKLASTDAGKQLMGMVQRQQGSNLNQAIAKANAGDYSDLQKTVQQLLSSPEGKKLVDQLGL